MNHRIRKVTVSTGIITTVAGTGTTTFTGDNGPATSGTLRNPQGVALDSLGTYLGLLTCSLFTNLSFYLGNVYISDTYNNRLRKVTISTGIITTIAGTGSTTFSGDNGQASFASLYNPIGVALDSLDNVYIADQSNNRLRKVTMAIATSTPRYSHTTSSVDTLSTPNTSNLFLLPSTSTSPTLVPSTSTPTTSTPSSNYPSLSPSTVYIMTTIAGTGTQSYSGDNGQATSAGLYNPYGIRVDAAGE